MARVAPRVHVSADAIARLEEIGSQLQQDVRVQLLLDDGSTVTGIVDAQPSVQMFFDPQGREGCNALVRIERIDDDRGQPANVIDLWLDQVSAVTRVPNPSPPQPSQRTSPPDPNAPTVR
jgi:hypothetical protein